MLHGGRWPSILLATTLLACSPALNWRQARIDAAIPLQLLMPCKPDRAERQVVMGDRPLALHMLGCDADGATFAVSHVRVADAAAAAALLAGWKSAVLSHVQAQSVQDQAWSPSGGQPGWPAQRVQALGRRADGKPVAVQAVWFGVAGRDAMHLFHAVVLSPRPRPELGEAFFSGIAAAP